MTARRRRVSTSKYTVALRSKVARESIGNLYATLGRLNTFERDASDFVTMDSGIAELQQLVFFLCCQAFIAISDYSRLTCVAFDLGLYIRRALVVHQALRKRKPHSGRASTCLTNQIHYSRCGPVSQN
jgi:hypothetical protein